MSRKPPNPKKPAPYDYPDEETTLGHCEVCGQERDLTNINTASEPAWLCSSCMPRVLHALTDWRGAIQRLRRTYQRARNK